MLRHQNEEGNEIVIRAALRSNGRTAVCIIRAVKSSELEKYGCLTPKLGAIDPG
jgi:hypothetical protein